MLPVVAGINHGVCTEPRCACADALARELVAAGVHPVMQKHSPSAIVGAQRTLRRALEAAGTGDAVLYIEDDAVLAPDFGERLGTILSKPPPEWAGVLFLFSAREGPPVGEIPIAELRSRPVAGAVAVLLTRAAAELATLEAHRAASSVVPVERLFVNAGKVHGDATVWPSLVDHRAELESVHRPGSGGKGTSSPSFRAAYASAEALNGRAG